MEQEIQVKTVEDKQETSPQEKEAAVLETAVKEGEVNPDYGLQDDGVYKVNLDNPPKQKQAGQEVQEKNEEKPKESSEQSKKEEDKEEKIESPIELVTDEAKEDPTEPIEDIVEEEKVSTEENKNIEYPENIQKLVEFMDETGGTLEDYVSLNKD
jgi:hypothetical protein